MITVLLCRFCVRLSFQEVGGSAGPDECGIFGMLPSQGGGCGEGNTFQSVDLLTRRLKNLVAVKVKLLTPPLLLQGDR